MKFVYIYEICFNLCTNIPVSWMGNRYICTLEKMMLLLRKGGMLYCQHVIQVNYNFRPKPTLL